MNAEKLMKTIEAIEIPRPYRAYPHEVIAIHNANNGGAFGIANDAYRYGFLKGQRAAKAEARREKKQLAARDTTGWHGYLSRWLERNIDNEHLLSLTGEFARAMEGRAKEVTPHD